MPGRGESTVELRNSYGRWEQVCLAAGGGAGHLGGAARRDYFLGDVDDWIRLRPVTALGGVGVADSELLARTFVALADSLVDVYDPVGFLHSLASRCVSLFGAAEAGVMLTDQRGGLQVLASSSERMRLLELFELQSEEGPCLDSHRHGERVDAASLEESQNRWPRFAPAALDSGFCSVLALPMRLRSDRIGALNLFLVEPGELAESDLSAAQAFADVATVGILHDRSVREAYVLSEQLQTALQTRAVIEQSKGVLAEQAQVDVDEAFHRLHHYARAHHQRLDEVARAVISGKLSATDIAPDGAPAGLEHLTRQELRVALAVAGGASNREAAAALLVSPRTVEAHLSHIYRKLGVHSRSQLALRVMAAERESTRRQAAPDDTTPDRP